MVFRAQSVKRTIYRVQAPGKRFSKDEFPSRDRLPEQRSLSPHHFVGAAAAEDGVSNTQEDESEFSSSARRFSVNQCDH